MEEPKKVLLGLSLDELKGVAASLGLPAFAGKQMAQWLYEKRVTDIGDMTNLSKQNRERLSAEYCVGAMAPVDCQRSIDGTVKYLFPVRTDGKSAKSGQADLFVETVRVVSGGLQDELPVLPDG